MELNIEEIKKIIPHRDPMLLLSHVEELIPQKCITATFFIDPNREIFKGHFPDEPVFPGVYSVECMAQASDVLLLSMDEYKNKKPLFLGIDKVKFKKKILPGEIITIKSQIESERKEKAIVTCSATIYLGEDLAASALVTLAMR